ncbi:pitrilysin family protein [Oleispirillum naphthae]|uniref:M16 family metallopeptidase n=1 Tax=Oleispirillum naphthae TaxID=2838853 RepID=UPI0030823AC7
MKRILLALLLLIAPLPALAAPVQVVASPGGVTAWLVEDHANPLVAVSLLFRGGGAAADPADKAGLATVASGMLDEGAAEMDSRAFQDRLDALNVSMSFSAARDSFSGEMLTLSAHRAEAFALLRDALTRPRFDAEPLERMRAAFLTRLRRQQENPGSRASQALFAALFPQHPYGRPTAGTVEGISAVGAADLHAFARSRFTRDRLIVGVVGDISAAELAPLLDATFGGLPATSPLPPVAETAPALSGKTLTVEMPVPQAVAIFAQAGPGRADPDWLPFQVMMYVLGDGGFSSRLTAEVREKRGLAYGVDAGSLPLADAPLVAGSVGTQTAKIGESISIIRAEWEKMRAHGATAEEVEKAKSFLAGSLPLRLNSSPAIAGTLTALLYYRLPPDELDRRAAEIAAITPADVARVAAKWLTPDKLTFAVAGETAKMHLDAQ